MPSPHSEPGLHTSLNCLFLSQVSLVFFLHIFVCLVAAHMGKPKWGWKTQMGLEGWLHKLAPLGMHL